MTADPFKHFRIIGALMVREVSTRFGRDGLGFAWLVVEPLAFCVGVVLMWKLFKPEYEHGIRTTPFVFTGYTAIVLIRHLINFSMNALHANVGLLYHRDVTAVHIFLSRNFLEFAGASLSFIVVYAALATFNQIELPHDLLLLYSGWFLLGWVGMGTGLSMAGLAMRFDVIERVVPIVTYLLIPLSGAFVMVEWIPYNYRELYLLIPFAHGIEMIRSSVFGEFTPTHYHASYALAVGTALNILGLLLISISKNRVEIE
ncbi:Polysialic acid transport protein KpsM [Brevundimonas subvibrioides]|uniref:ABC transporter permease n=1 Tax=Brevundimonas subvibrioides TaxID=74313 RepID=UPI0032D5A2CB